MYSVSCTFTLTVEERWHKRPTANMHLSAEALPASSLCFSLRSFRSRSLSCSKPGHPRMLAAYCFLAGCLISASALPSTSTCPDPASMHCVAKVTLLPLRLLTVTLASTAAPTCMQAYGQA